VRLVVEHSAKIAHVEPAFKEVKLNPRRLMLTASEIAERAAVLISMA
jgi:hypothetical protein